MKKVLVIAFYFPPLGGAGVQRTLKFVKYLPEFDWQPIVVTVNSHGSLPVDPSMTEEIPPDISIYRTPAFLLSYRLPWRVKHFISQWFLFVDEHLGWFPFAVRKCIQIVRDEHIQAIFTTSAPYTDHLVGHTITHRFPLPWVADFRDPWVGNFSSSFPTAFHESLALRIEKHILRSADRVTVVSEPMRQSFLSRNPGLSDSRIVSLPNGYDPADFKNLSLPEREPGKFVVAYTGSFYGQRLPHRFLAGLRTAMEEDQRLRQEIQVWFVGNMGKLTAQAIEEAGLNDIVKMTGYLPHKQAVARLLAADLLLLVIGAGPGSEAVFTAKIFEYLAAGKPVLALVPEGPAEQLIREAGSGIVVHPDDIQAIAQGLLSLFHQWQEGKLAVFPRREVIAQFDRRALTGRLAAILNELTD